MWSPCSSYVSDGPVVLHCHVCLIKLQLFQLSICGPAVGLCWGGDYNYNGSGGDLVRLSTDETRARRECVCMRPCMLLSSHGRVKLAAFAEPRTAARAMTSSKLNLARCACARLLQCHAKPTIDTCRSRELTFTLIAITMMSRLLRRHLAFACSIVSSKIVFQAFLRSVSPPARP